MLRLIVLLLLLSSLSSGHAKTSDTAESEYGNIEFITESKLYTYLSYIASDALEGRDTPSRGLDSAAHYIARHLKSWGYTPVGDSGTYFQYIPLVRNRLSGATATVSVGDRTFEYGKDFIAQSNPGSVSANAVFVNAGYIIRAKNINPYEGLDVKGKVIIALGAYPKGISARDFKGKAGVDYDTPLNYGKTHGAAGVIVMPSVRALRDWNEKKISEVVNGTVFVPALKKEGEIDPIPYVTASPHLIDAIFEGENTGVASMSDRASAENVKPFELRSSKKISLSLSVMTDTLMTQNVVAVLEGSDKTKKNEYIAFGAHYDHLGVRHEPVNGDSIYNGADDDGSGTVGLIAMAEAYAAGPRPKRSLLFVWHTGEEKGLWGSKFFVKYPVVPLTSIVAQLNMDMIGRSRQDSGSASVTEDFSAPGEIYSIGSRMMSTELGLLNEQVNGAVSNFRLNYKFDDPNDPHRLFYRSDHYSYAKNGIPIVFYFDGIHSDYHKVTDEIDKIDFTKLTMATKTICALGWKIANLPHRLVVDKQFDRDIIE